MIPSQDQIPYNGIEREDEPCRRCCPQQGLKTKFRITELKVGRYHVELVIAVVSQDQIPYNGIESPAHPPPCQGAICLKTKFRITELKGIDP